MVAVSPLLANFLPNPMKNLIPDPNGEGLEEYFKSN